MAKIECSRCGASHRVNVRFTTQEMEIPIDESLINGDHDEVEEIYSNVEISLCGECLLELLRDLV